MIKFKPFNKTYDYIIPLGEECYTCQSIDSKFNNDIRKCAFPFDYVGHTFIETIQQKLQNIIFNNEPMLEKNDIDIKLFTNAYFYVDKKYGFNYWHDTSYTDYKSFTEKDMTIFLDKYKRRYERLIDIIKNNNKIIFITVNHYDNIHNDNYKKDELINLYDTLMKFNNNIFLLAFNYDTSSYHHNNLFHINLEYNKNNLSFEESKALFLDILYKYINENLSTVII